MHGIWNSLRHRRAVRAALLLCLALVCLLPVSAATGVRGVGGATSGALNALPIPPAPDPSAQSPVLSPDGDYPLVGVSLWDLADDWDAQIRHRLDPGAQPENWFGLRMHDARRDPAQQVAQMEDLLVAGVDVIAFTTGSPDALSVFLQYAHQAGVPAVHLSHSGRVLELADVNIVPDRYAAGRILGEQVAGGTSGPGLILVLEPVGSFALGPGVEDALGPNTLHTLVVRQLRWDGADYADSVSEIMRRYTSDAYEELAAVICAEPAMARSAAAWLAQEGLAGRVEVCAAGRVEAVQDLILDGISSFGVATDPSDMTDAMLQAALGLYGGEAQEQIIAVEPLLIFG